MQRKTDSKPADRIVIRKATDEDYARLERQGWLVTTLRRAPPWQQKPPEQQVEQPAHKPDPEKNSGHTGSSANSCHGRIGARSSNS